MRGRREEAEGVWGQGYDITVDRYNLLGCLLSTMLPDVCIELLLMAVICCFAAGKHQGPWCQCLWIVCTCLTPHITTGDRSGLLSNAHCRQTLVLYVPSGPTSLYKSDAAAANTC